MKIPKFGEVNDKILQNNLGKLRNDAGKIAKANNAIKKLTQTAKNVANFVATNWQAILIGLAITVATLLIIAFLPLVHSTSHYYCDLNAPSFIKKSHAYQRYCQDDPCGAYDDSSSSGGGTAPDIEGEALENAQKIYSTFKVYGFNDEAIAGMLGVMTAESGVRSKRIEGDGVSDFSSVSDLKAMHSYCDNNLFPRYDSGGVDYNRNGYLYKGYYTPGLGLIQFTAGRAGKLMDFAEANGLEWYDIDTQIQFMLSDQDIPLSYLDNWAQNADSDALGECRYFFWTCVYGSNFAPRAGSDKPSTAMINSNGTNYEIARGAAAKKWYEQMQSWTVDEAYGEEMLAKAKAAKAGGTGAGGSGVSKDCSSGSSTVGKAMVSVDGELDFEGYKAKIGNRLTTAAEAAEIWNFITGGGSKFTNALGAVNYQCTYFAAYTFWVHTGNMWLKGNGGEMAENLIAEHGDKYMNNGAKPAPGGVISTKDGSYGHVLFIHEVRSDGKVIISDGNVIGAGPTGTSTTGIRLMHEWDWDYFVSTHGGSGNVVVAAPRN